MTPGIFRERLAADPNFLSIVDETENNCPLSFVLKERPHAESGGGVTDRQGSVEAKRLEPAVVAELYSRHAAELRAYLLGLLRDADLAVEVVQATFVKAAESGHTVAEGSMRAWLFQVAHNEALDRRRRSVVESRVIRKLAWWKRTGELLPELLVDRAETIERVRQAIDNLPAEQREIVRIRIYEEKTFAEIATQLGAPLGTVLTRMRLATKKLTDALRAEIDP